MVATIERPRKVLDSHVHFWDVDELDYPWLTDAPALNRTWTPEELFGARSRPRTADVTGVVFVQADCSWSQAGREMDWVAALVDQGAPIVGAVAAVPLERGISCRDQIVALQADPLVVGVRRLLQDMPPGFALEARFIEAVQLLGDAGLTFDICVRNHQLKEAAALVRGCPEVTFVLDHLGKPQLSEEHWEPWAEDLASLSQAPNVYCKLSGLPAEAAGDATAASAFTAHLHHALDVFGPTRCMFGSDWPVSSVELCYDDWVSAVQQALGLCSEDECAAVWGGTAERAYGLDPGIGARGC